MTSMPPILYQLACINDIDALVELRAAFLAEVAEADPKDVMLLQALRTYFADAVPDGQFIAYLAVAQGEVVTSSGMIFHQNPPSARNPSGRSAYIMNMYTRPPWRGQGIATSLLQHLIAHARSQGCRRFSLNAVHAARPIYDRIGFRPTDDEMRLDVTT